VEGKTIAGATGQRVVRIESINVASEGAVVRLPFRATNRMEAPSRSIQTAAGQQEISSFAVWIEGKTDLPSLARRVASGLLYIAFTTERI
jgi:hypothetical protein